MVWCRKQRASLEKEGKNSGGGMCGLEDEKQGWAPLPGLQDVPGAGL